MSRTHGGKFHKRVGPPGTGKTTWLTREIERLAENLRGGRVILAASMTNAAAIELNSRIRVEGGRSSIHVRTLHSHAYKAIGADLPVFSTARQELVGEWRVYVEHAKAPAAWALTVGDEEDSSQRTTGDTLLAQYHVERSRLTPRTAYKPHVARFANVYERFKEDHGYIDFSDMVDLAFKDTDCGPGVPQYLLCDEAQDMDRAQFRLLLKWAKRPEVEKVVVVGDPKQNLYEWRGTEPEAFESVPAPERQRVVLEQSYRVPRAVWEMARSVSTRITDCRDDPYKPRDADGELVTKANPFTNKPTAESLAQNVLDKHGDEQSIMFLATCGYMLRPLISALRDEGVPFHNPYKRDNGEWNPLHKRAKSTSMAERLACYLAPDTEDRLWTPQELSTWIGACKVSGFLAKGAKKQIDHLAAMQAARPVTLEQLREWLLGEDILQQIIADPYEWFAGHVQARSIRHVRYLFRVIRRHGLQALYDAPRVIVGTVHSVKGGEADVVYVSTDMSPAEQFQWEQNKNPIHRKFYVAFTRARETLVVCRSVSQHQYPI